MRLIHARHWITRALVLLSLGNWTAAAPQAHSGTFPPELPGNSSEAALPSPGASVSLSELVEQALVQNPEIKAMQRNFDMMRARIPQAGALPEPMLSYGYTGNWPLPPFDIQKGDPSSARMLGFTQEIPFPGKLGLKAKMAAVSSESEWWAYEQMRLNVVAEVKDAYFDLVYFTKAIETVNKNKYLLERFAKISEARYAVGKGIQQDVLKAQVEISKLIDQVAVLEQRKQTAEARLNSLLYREPDSPVGKPEEIKPREFSHTIAELRELALANYPMLKAQRRKIDREQYGVQLAQKEFYPDVTVGFTYFNRPGLPEMYGVNVGVTIPLYFWKKQRPAIAEAAASEAMERKRLDGITTLLFFKIKDAYLAATTAQKLVSLYGTTVIPQATLSLESAISGYEVGKVDFLTLLDSLVTLRSYELNYYEQLSNVEKAVASMEPLVGVDLRK
jgi:outer membrane protein TolC